MSFEEEFDSIIRRKVEGESYPFDESNWEKTSAMLDAERGVTRALKIKQLYLPAVLVLAIGAAGLMTYNYFGSANEKEGNAKELAVANENLTGSKNANQLIEKSTLNNLSANVSQPSLEIENTITSTNNVKQTSAPAALNTNENAVIASGETNSLKQKSAPEKTEEVIESKLPLAKENEKSGKLPEASKPIENTSDPINSNASKAEKFASDTQDSQVQEDINSTSNADILKAGTKAAEKNDSANDSGSGDQTPIATSAFIPASAEAETEDAVYAEQLIAVYSALPYEVSEVDLHAIPFVYLERYDDDYYSKNPKTHYMNFEAGGNYLLGWNANKGTDGQGLNWYAGFNYGRYLCSKFNVSIGIQAYNIANIKQPFYMVASKEYGFGSNLVYTKVSSDQLYYVAIPLKFNYALNSKNMIGLGVNAAYLIGANNTVSKYYVLDNEVKTIGSNQSTSGIYKGTNMMNLMLTASYKTQFSNRIGLNMEFNYGLSDLFKNTELVKTNERPMGLRLGLTYTLFDK